MKNNNPESIDDGSRVLTRKQCLYVAYLNAILLYLTVLNFCEEYWSWVHIKSFTVSVLVSILLLFGLILLMNTEKKPQITSRQRLERAQKSCEASAHIFYLLEASLF